MRAELFDDAAELVESLQNGNWTHVARRLVERARVDAADGLALALLVASQLDAADDDVDTLARVLVNLDRGAE